MEESRVRSILRIFAVLAILAGATLVTRATVQRLAVSSTFSGFGSLGEQTAERVRAAWIYLILADATISGWGFILYCLSPWLAKRISQ
ncbi:MAG: hypothetical protein O7H41_02705 [Planctomycetota bacterium]|nr:hypothetical protein [Planctomycetota bacterium]